MGSASLFSIDENDVLSTTSFVNNTFGGFLLSDDTFVGAFTNGNLRFRTYAYTASNNSWNSIPGTELSVATSAQWAGDISTYRASDSHLVFIDFASADYHVALYARQADRSWSYVESITVNNTFDPKFGNVVYNDVDTLVYSRPVQAVNTDFLGIVFVYTKMNGNWVEQTFTVESVGYKAKGLLGAQVIFTDPNTLYISAGYENVDLAAVTTTALIGGKILLLTRNTSGLWEPTVNLVGGDYGVFGLGFGINDYDIIVPIITADAITTPDGVSGNPITLYTAPRCFRDPIDVTCTDQQVNDCSKFSTDLLYTINNPHCGVVTASISSLSLINNQQMNAQFTFTRSFASPVYCNATVTCPAPPVTPNSAQTPGAVTQTPGARISSADVRQLFCLVSFVLAALLVSVI